MPFRAESLGGKHVKCGLCDEGGLQRWFLDLDFPYSSWVLEIIRGNFVIIVIVYSRDDNDDLSDLES
jgi:hypothetical protein